LHNVHCLCRTSTSVIIRYVSLQIRMPFNTKARKFDSNRLISEPHYTCNWISRPFWRSQYHNLVLSTMSSNSTKRIIQGRICNYCNKPKEEWRGRLRTGDRCNVTTWCKADCERIKKFKHNREECPVRAIKPDVVNAASECAAARDTTGKCWSSA